MRLRAPSPARATGVLAAAVLLAACGSGSGGSTTTSAAGAAGGGGNALPADCTIGFSVYDLQFEFFQRMQQGVKAEVQAAGCKYLEFDQKSDPAAQVTGTTALINQGISALVISPFKPEALGPIVAEAKKRKIPVIVDDIGGGGTAYDAIVVSNNADGGKQAADYMDKTITANKLPKKVASFACPPEYVYAVRRTEGFKARMKELGYQVVTDINVGSGQNTAEGGFKATQDALSKTPDLAGIMNCNDELAQGDANAVAQAGKKPGKDVVIIGFDGNPAAVQLIKQGKINGSVAQNPVEMGKIGVRLAVDKLKGTQLKLDDAANREAFVPVQLVTPANVASYKP